MQGDSSSLTKVGPLRRDWKEADHRAAGSEAAATTGGDLGSVADVIAASAAARAAREGGGVNGKQMKRKSRNSGAATGSEWHEIRRKAIDSASWREVWAITHRGHFDPKAPEAPSGKQGIGSSNFHVARVVDPSMRNIGGAPNSSAANSKRRRRGKSLLSELVADPLVQDWTAKKVERIQASSQKAHKTNKGQRKKK
eukprot:GHVU01141012.1.p1 GENE.GHVU01141012.1~~GHVU01141012.1.p1  ORF type:complete len:197 (-),score=35.88 GHVU01141012.1:334-924(-)